jgi:single-strand DNA-binding protein
MNRVCLVGRLTAKPELRYTPSNVPTTRFSIAVNRTFKNEQGRRDADFINILAWRKTAELICNYVD